MYDRYNRRIHYLRISVTDRCNLRCVYCMPAEGISLVSHDDILRYDEIIEVARIAVDQGVDKVRLTGGEPLVRRGIVDLVRELAQIKGIRDLAMTTNGTLLGGMARDLKQAGLHRVNVSLDTMDPVRYKAITRGGNLNLVLEGLQAADQANLTPIKLNCVIEHSSSEPDAQAVAEFAHQKGYKVRFIHRMNLKEGYFLPVEGGEGGVCERCNRLRLTSDGLIKPCLFSDTGYSVRALGAREAIRQAVENKPWCGGRAEQTTFFGTGG